MGVADRKESAAMYGWLGAEGAEVLRLKTPGGMHRDDGNDYDDEI